MEYFLLRFSSGGNDLVKHVSWDEITIRRDFRDVTHHRKEEKKTKKSCVCTKRGSVLLGRAQGEKHFPKRVVSRGSVVLFVFVL